jgi:hypothetical protein
MLAAGTVLTRIYNRDYLGPDQYNHHGPRARFDHHDPGLPRSDLHHGVYYAADDLAGCIIEVFGDRGEIETMNYGVATVTLRRDLRLLDLNGGGAWEAGSVAALTQDADCATTQTWARHFYDDQTTYGALDGLRYENAHNRAIGFGLPVSRRCPPRRRCRHVAWPPSRPAHGDESYEARYRPPEP